MAQRFTTRTRSSDDGIFIEGAREFRSQLKAIDALLPRKLREVNLKAAELVVPEAKRRMVVSSPDVGKPGHIRDTVRAQATQRTAILTAGSAAQPHIFPTEFGWPSRGIKASPAIYPAISAKGDEILEAYGELVDEVFRDAFPIGGLI